MNRVQLALVAAMGRNRVIGRDGALPWRLASDLKRFKAATLGKPILMGRATWESLGRPLPGRANLILTRNPRLLAPDCWVYSELEAALAAGRALAAATGADELCVIGGETLYAQTIAQADRLYISEVDASPDGDAHFPDFDAADFRETSREALVPGPRDDHGFVWRVLERVS